MNVIEVSELTKIYKAPRKKMQVLALDNFSLNVNEGQIFGLLGPNGAGKTTFIKILLGITHPTIGNAKMLDRPLSDLTVKSRVGYLPENHKYPSYLDAEELLKYFARLSAYKNKNLDSRIDYLLKLVKMERWKKVKIKKYSKGMMQRLGLAISMVNEPDVIFLDEPTDGVDPIGRKEIRDVLIELKNQGRTIFLNSHLLSEVELISDKVAILNKGKLLREGSVTELTTKKEQYNIELDRQLTPDDINLLDKDSFVDQKGNMFTLHFKSIADLNHFLDFCRRKSYNIISVVPQKQTLEEMFINIINDSEKN